MSPKIAPEAPTETVRGSEKTYEATLPPSAATT